MFCQIYKGCNYNAITESSAMKAVLLVMEKSLSRLTISMFFFILSV
jgi:hypothetical protein